MQQAQSRSQDEPEEDKELEEDVEETSKPFAINSRGKAVRRSRKIDGDLAFVQYFYLIKARTLTGTIREESYLILRVLRCERLDEDLFSRSPRPPEHCSSSSKYPSELSNLHIH